MDTYLTETLEKLKSGNYANLSMVLGNESCDLDSAVSATVYASFLNWQYNQIKCKVCTKSKRDETVYKDDIFVPILNVDKEDYDLKTEVSFCFKEHGIDASKLVFRDDFDLPQLVSGATTGVTLVDHHNLAKRDQFLAPVVTEIIDHRPVDKSDWKYRDDTRVNIELVGSCCSLVTQRIRGLGSLIAKDVDFFNAYPAAADMLHSCIILDTVNFSKEVNKARPVDDEAVLFLESILKPKDYLESRKDKLDRLVAARKDVSRLTAAQLLRKDVKIIEDVLVPSFPILVEEWSVRPGAPLAVTEALQRRGCELALLLGMSLEGGLVRDVAVFGNDDNRELAVKFAKFLQEWRAPSLELVQQELPTVPNFIYFKQNNLAASRKQYMPAIAAFYENNKK